MDVLSELAAVPPGDATVEQRPERTGHALRLFVGGWRTSAAPRGSTPGCARRRGTDRAARHEPCAVPQALRAGRLGASRRRPAGCVFLPTWPPLVLRIFFVQTMRRAAPIS